MLRDKKIRRESAVRHQVAAQLVAARRDPDTARRLGPEEEWAYTIAYNAMLLAGRAVMFSEGYRPTTGEGGHAAVVEFLRIRLGARFQPAIDLMDRMRRQRHRIVYETAGSVSPSQIAEAVGIAEDFVTKVEALLRGSSDDGTNG
ncbi:MAG: HEPN domain-containing protein [Armatimonadetes bacterium]|nr:HEPN domain-containing protein [Armatimonadota bacterium]